VKNEKEERRRKKRSVKRENGIGKI